MRIKLIAFLSILSLVACKNDADNSSMDTSAADSTQTNNKQHTDSLIQSKNQDEQHADTDTTVVDMLFSPEGFNDKKYYELLIETHLCDPSYDKNNPAGKTPCSSRLFKFYPYNHKRDIKNAFMLQVKAGVNNYPYRRLLIFVRENGKLVLMNGIVGYLVKRIAQPNGIDDLIVGIVDDLGNNNFSRYDVLLRYKDGKYRFVEALGDLRGTFDTPKLKNKASKAIKKQIEDKELIF